MDIFLYGYTDTLKKYSLAIPTKDFILSNTQLGIDQFLIVYLHYIFNWKL